MDDVRIEPKESGELKPNRIVIEFVDDHTIEGVAVEVYGVTPLQIYTATYVLQRTANQLQDAIDHNTAVARQMHREEAIEIARAIPEGLEGRNGGRH